MKMEHTMEAGRESEQELPYRIFSVAETSRLFVPLRDRIFAVSPVGGISESSPRIFRDEAWTRIIIRGSLWQSDRRSWKKEDFVTDGEFDLLDPRDELQPLFDILAEDGIDEVIQMCPYDLGDEHDAVGVRPLRSDICFSDNPPKALMDLTRLTFDRTGRWGFYASLEEFGLLGGEPAFMDRYIEKAGGMKFIREKADMYWQADLDDEDYEAPFVPHYYELAGWGNPPVKRA